MLALIKRPQYVLDTKASYKNSYKPRTIPLYEKLYFAILFWPIVSPILGYFNSKKTISDSMLSMITNVEIDGIDHSDYPKFVDAYINNACWLDSLTPLTDVQIDQLNNYSDFVYEQVQKHLY